MILLEPMPLDELTEWCIEHDYLMVVSYHAKVRYLTPISTFRKPGGVRISAFDSTHAGEEHPNTYKLEEIVFLGLTRFRPTPVQIQEVVDG